MIVDLDGRVAVVTGAASGIGKASAAAFAAEGMRIVLADVNDERLAESVREIQSRGGQAVGVHCDVARDEHIAALHRSAREAYGPVDLVMSNVGVLVLGEPAEIPIDAWQRVLDIDLLSVAWAIRKFLPAMLERRIRHFVNTASTAGLWGYGAERLPYVVAKAAIVAVSEALAAYARPAGDRGDLSLSWAGGHQHRRADHGARCGRPCIGSAAGRHGTGGGRGPGR